MEEQKDGRNRPRNSEEEMEHDEEVICTVIKDSNHTTSFITLKFDKSQNSS